jgi:hypothetical protein
MGHPRLFAALLNQTFHWGIAGAQFKTPPAMYFEPAPFFMARWPIARVCHSSARLSPASFKDFGFVYRQSRNEMLGDKRPAGFQPQRAVRWSQQANGKSPVYLIKNALRKCPDQRPALGTTELAFQYADLPGRLWATTGIRIPNLQKFQSFGRLRNTIQHFASPNNDCSFEAINFIFEVIDPLINQCWGLFAADYNEDYEYRYLIEHLISRGVRFLISGNVVTEIANNGIDFEWPEGDEAYKQEMEARIEAARENHKALND